MIFCSLLGQNFAANMIQLSGMNVQPTRLTFITQNENRLEAGDPFEEMFQVRLLQF